MSKTVSGKRRYIVTVTVSVTTSNQNETKTFEHKFCSDNPTKYLENYHARLHGLHGFYGWTKVIFSEVKER